jgi:hypothetical protein
VMCTCRSGLKLLIVIHRTIRGGKSEIAKQEYAVGQRFGGKSRLRPCYESVPRHK